MKDDPCANERKEYQDALVALTQAQKKSRSFAAKEVKEGEDFPCLTPRERQLITQARKDEAKAKKRFLRAKQKYDECRQMHNNEIS